MVSRESTLHWSFSAGTWFSTRVRVSVFFPLVLLVVWAQLKDFPVAAVFSVILLLSVLAHEFGHVLAARATGGGGDEILIWPLGGLAFVQSGPGVASRLMTSAAGPLFNLAVCAIVAWPVSQSALAAEAFNPLVFPLVTLTDRVLSDVLVLIFTANWILLLVNLIPVYPLDGGRMLQTVLTARWGGDTGGTAYIRIGFLCAFAILLGGMMVESVWVVSIGAIVLVLNMQETTQRGSSDEYDDSFMGYDFSAGYTSLERESTSAAEKRPGLLQRWKEKRRLQKEQQEREDAEEAERRLDELLAKVHEHGMDSLTDAEKRQLRQVSDRYRDRTDSDR
jgi:stage IV sporulation protein FB